MRRLLAALFAFSLLAAACGDDTGAGDAGSGPVSTAAPAAGDTADAAGSGDTGDSGDSGDTADSGDSAPVEPFASYTGVTADAVKIGVASIDAQQLMDRFNYDVGIVPVEEMYRAWGQALNDAGGVGGRSVEFAFADFLPIGPDEAAQTCVELTEDEEVFVVIGQYLQDNMLCVTESHGLPYVGHFGETPERQRRSEGRFFATEIGQLPQRVGAVNAMIAAGDFDGRTVGLTWQDPADRDYADAVRPLLQAAGVNVATETEIGALTTDQVNNSSAWDIAVQKMLSEGVDLILHLSDIVPPLDAVGRAEADLTVALTNGQAADGTTVISQSTASEQVKANSFAVTTFKPSAAEALSDPGVQQCLDEFSAAYPDEAAALDLTNDDIVNGVTNHCRAFRLTIAIIEAAGADLTPDTFRAAGESLGDIDLPAMAAASLGPDKHSAGSLLVRYRYQPAEGDADGSYVRDGEPFLAEY